MRIGGKPAQCRHRLADEGQQAKQFAPRVDGATAGAVEQRDEAGRADRIRRRSRARLAHLAEQALDRRVLAADRDLVVDAFQGAECAVDQIRAGGVDFIKLGHVEYRVVGDLGVAELFLDLSDRPDGPIARDGKNLLSVCGSIHLKSC